MSLYALHRLCQNSQTFINSFTASNRARSDAFSLSLASAVVNALQDSKQGLKEYDQKTESKVLAALSSVNELIRFDVDKVNSFINKLCKFRTSQNGWRSATKIVHSETTAIADFFGISDHFSEADLLVIIKEGQQIANDALQLNTLFRDLRLFNE